MSLCQEFISGVLQGYMIDPEPGYRCHHTAKYLMQYLLATRNVCGVHRNVLLRQGWTEVQK